MRDRGPRPGRGEPLDAVLERHRLTPAAVLLTHGHLDHVWSVAPVCGARGVPAWIHPDDRVLLSDPLRGMSADAEALFGGRLTFTEPDDVRLLTGDEPVEIAGMRFAVDLAPGHTPGSVAFRLPVPGRDGEPATPAMFAGDLLFAGSIGRTDLPGGDLRAMLASLSRVVLPLADETVVLPGHGPATTIGRERATNPYLQDLPPAPPSRGL